LVTEVILGKKATMQGALQLMPGEIVGNDGDFICITCILSADKLENFEIVVTIYVRLIKLQALTTGRLYHLSNGHAPLCPHTLLLSGPKKR
jgi:hypothetical protein